MEGIQLVKIQSPFDRTKRTVEVKDCHYYSLLDLRNSEVPIDVDFVVSVNGLPISQQDFPITKIKPGDCIVFTPKIEGGDILRTIAAIAIVFVATQVMGPLGYTAGATMGEMLFGEFAADAILASAYIGQALATAGTIIAGSMLVNAVLPSPKLPSSDYDRSNVYSWNPVTTQQQGAPIPIIYGKHRVYGNIISGYLDLGEGFSTDQSKLNLLIGLGMGPVKAISNLRVNDQLLSSYPGVVVDTRLGYLSQTAISLFDATKVTYLPNREVRADSGSYTYTTPGNSFDGLEIVLSFPKGVYHIDDAGDVASNPIKVSVEVRNSTLGESFRHVLKTGGDTSIVVPGRWSAGYYAYNDSGPVWIEVMSGSSDISEHYENEPYPTGGVWWHWIEETKITPVANDYLIVDKVDTSPFTYTIKLRNLSHGEYEIRVTKISADVDSMRWGDTVRLYSVVEVYNNNQVYPRMALAGLQALASEHISGSLKFSCDVFGKLVRVYRADEVLGTDGKNYRCIANHVSSSDTRPVTGSSWSSYWEQTGHGALALVDGSSGTEWTNGTSYSATPSWRTEYSDNPAWVAFDILTQPVYLSVARYDAYDPSYVNLDSVLEWADYCDELVDNGSGGLERRSTFNGVFDSLTTVWDAVLSVCQMSYACPVWSGTTVKFVVEKARNPVQLFTIGNILEDTFKETFLSLNERTGELEVEFVDQDQDYNRTTLTLVDTTSERPSNKVNKSFIGVTKTSEANRLGYRYLAYNKYQRRIIDFSADVDAIACEIGDRIDLAHDVPQWGYSGRIVSATSNTVTLDRTITIESGKTGADYTIKIRLSNDTIVTKTLYSGMGPGDYTTLTISDTFSTVPQQYDPYVIGVTSVVVKPVIVVGVRKTSDQTIGLTCVDYYDEVYTFDSGKVFSTPVNYSSLNRLVVITSVTATEKTSVNSINATIERSIIINYETDTNAVCKGALISVFELVSGRLTPVITLSTNTKKAIFSGAKPDTTYVFVVQGYNPANELSPFTVIGDTNRTSITTSSDNSALRGLYRVVGLQIVDHPNTTIFTGKDVAFTWRRVSVVDLNSDAGSETYGAATSMPDLLFKHYYVQIYESDGVTRRGKGYITTESLFTYTFEQNVKDGNGTPVASFVISVDAVNIFNEKTSKPATLAVSNVAPDPVDTVTVDFYSKHLLLNWTKCNDEDFKHYIVTLNGKEKIVGDNRYVYTFDENKSDNGSADPSVSYSIKVVDVFNNISSAVSGTAVNSAPAPVASIIGEGWFKSAQFNWSPSTEADFSHFLYRLKVDNGAWESWKECQGTFIHRALTSSELDLYGSEVAVYIEVKVVDSYGQESSAVGADATTTGLNIEPTDINDFAITASKLFTKIPVVSGDSWTNNSPSSGYVSWNQHTLYYNGVAYTIAAGNTSNKYIYWDGSSSYYSTTNTNPVLADNQFIIATNINGYHDLAWNAIANEVIGSAYIESLAVNDAHIASVSVGKLTAGEIAVGQHIRGGQTAYATGTGFYLGITAGGVPQFSVGDSSSYITYSSGTLSVKGNITIVGGSVPWSTVSGTGKPEDNATVGANWSTNLTGIPTPLQSPSGAGLYLNSNYMGYYDGSNWLTYITNDGNMFARGSFYGSSFQTQGSYLAQSCANGATTIYLGSTSDFDSSGNCLILDSTIDTVSYTGKTATSLTGCSGVTAHTVSVSNRPIIVPKRKGIYICQAIGELWFFGDRGDGTYENLATIGLRAVGTDLVIGKFGSTNSSYNAIYALGKDQVTIYAQTQTGIAVEGYAAESGYGVEGFSNNSIGVYANSYYSWGLYAISLYGGEAIYSIGDIRLDGQLISVVSTGTAPFSIASTTVCTNLNSDLWDGYHFSDYLNQAVKTSSSPSFAGLTSTGDVVLNNNLGLYVKDSGGTSKKIAGLNSDNTTVFAVSAPGAIDIGYGATGSNPIQIRVGGANSQQITAGANDSGGTGYRVLRVPNA